MSSVTGLLRRGKNGTVKRLTRLVMPTLLRPHYPHLELTRIGTGDGAWVVPLSLVRPGWICYCVGVGLNATFDVALAHTYKCRVHSFDPTPQAIEYIESLEYDRSLLTFHPHGVWRAEATIRFYMSSTSRSVNHSVSDLHGTGRYFLAPCKRLSTVMSELGHSRLDLLKLDIEGSWLEVLADVVDSGIDVSTLCVEFDTPTSVRKILSAVHMLQEHGMKLVHRKRENYVFVRRELTASGR